MKHLTLFFALMGVFCSVSATVYYSQGSLSPSSLSSWNTGRAGGGSSPSSFVNPGDEFIIQNGHSMVTTQSWTIGASGSALRIETGGSLYGAHAILLTGTFQLFNEAKYFHDNNSSVSPSAGASIFGGTENFASGSTVEIRKWINNTTPLPASIIWGNLVINYESSIGGNWNQQGNLNSIQGDFILKRTGTTGQDFRLTTNTNLVLTVGGNLIIENAILYIKDGNNAGTSSVVQVNGDINLSGSALLNLGMVDFKPNNELRFKGSLNAFENANISSVNEEPMLVANGTNIQSLYTVNLINASIKVLPGAQVKLSTALSLGSLRVLIIAGTLLSGTNNITMNGGALVVPGGNLNSRSNIDMKDGVCQVCQGNGTYSFSTQWCATSGDTGIINFNNATVQFNRSVASAVRIGALNSKGKLFMTNESSVFFTGPNTGPSPNRGTVELTGNGTLSLDEYSKIAGNAFYNAAGGLLVVGAAAGLSTTGPVGNIQVDGARNFNFSGVNSYEFKSTLPQFTGNGFPSTISGSLRINNSSSLGVTLNNPCTINAGATLQMSKGILVATGNAALTMLRGSTFLGGSSASYINGPLKKFGETDFTYHIGKEGRYSPVTLRAGGGGNINDVYTVEYYPGNPTSNYNNTLSQLIEHISEVEYWVITGTGNRLRYIKFPITPYSGINHFPTLVMAYFDGIGWINLGNGTPSGNTSNGALEVAAVNYGPFTFGSTNINTNSMVASLPIHIKSFTARRVNNQALLSWELGSDTDADYIEILASKDNQHFIPIAKMEAKTGQFSYQYQDAHLQPGTNYYRIRVVEKNGNSLLSRIAAVIYEARGLELITVAPSIIQDRAMISVVSAEAASLQFTITDQQGRAVKQFNLPVVQGTNSLPFSVGELKAGVYFLYAISKDGRSNIMRIVKQ